MKKALLIIITCSISLHFYAQTGGLMVFELPEKYIVADESTNLLPDMEHVIKGRAWLVYSDRIDNKTYKSPNYRKILKSNIAFLSPFYVIDETDEFLHIFKDNNLGSNFTVSRSAIDYGWIPKNNLLMWDHCLVTVTNKSFKRVLFFGASIGSNKQELSLFHSPDLSDMTQMSIMVDIPVILYVYKETNNSLLVGAKVKIAHNERSENVFGWISKQKIVSWNNPVCLEENWENEAVLERVKFQIQPEIFNSIRKAENFKNGKIHKKYVWRGDNIELLNYGRTMGKTFRFPVINFHNNDLAEVILTGGSKSKVFGETGYAPLSCNHLTHPVFRKILLLSRLELAKMITDYNSLLNSFYKEKANGLQNTFLSMIRNKKSNSKDECLLGLSIGEITKILYGAVSESDFKHLKLRYLNNNYSKADSNFKSYINHLEKNIIELKMIFNSDNYPYSFKMFDELYYWIPVSLIP